MTYPDHLLRGVYNDEYIGPDNEPTSTLFYFDYNKPPRDDGLRAFSINWHDDDGALDSIFLQRKDDKTLQFKAGAAVLSRADLDLACHNHIVSQHLHYERQVLPNNKYHGNLLLEASVQKPRMHKIASAIALCVTHVIPNPHSV